MTFSLPELSRLTPSTAASCSLMSCLVGKSLGVALYFSITPRAGPEHHLLMPQRLPALTSPPHIRAQLIQNKICCKPEAPGAGWLLSIQDAGQSLTTAAPERDQVPDRICRIPSKPWSVWKGQDAVWQVLLPPHTPPRVPGAQTVFALGRAPSVCCRCMHSDSSVALNRTTLSINAVQHTHMMKFRGSAVLGDGVESAVHKG